jgi:hypothetical protein
MIKCQKRNFTQQLKKYKETYGTSCIEILRIDNPNSVNLGHRLQGDLKGKVKVIRNKIRFLRAMDNTLLIDAIYLIDNEKRE